jgi:hypothetical protein
MGKLKLLFGFIVSLPLLVGAAISDDDVVSEPTTEEVIEQVCET